MTRKAGRRQKQRYDSKRLHAALEGLAGKDSLGIVTIPSADLPPGQAESTCRWQAFVVEKALLRGERPDLGLFLQGDPSGMVLTADTPRTDPRWEALAWAHERLGEMPAEIALQPLLRGQQLAAYQVACQADTRRMEVRLNDAIRGIFWAMPRPRWIDVGWELPADEREKTAHVTVINGHANGQIAKLVYWRNTPALIHGAEAKALVKLTGRSIGIAGAKERWRSVQNDGNFDPEETRSALWEAVRNGVHPDRYGAYIVDVLETLHGKGLPGRKSPYRKSLVPLDDKSEVEAGNVSGFEDAAAVKMAISELAERDHEILKRHSDGETDAEIGSALGISQQAVNKRRIKALVDLRKLLS